MVELFLYFKETSNKRLVLSIDLLLECADLLEEDSSCFVDFGVIREGVLKLRELNAVMVVMLLRRALGTH